MKRLTEIFWNEIFITTVHIVASKKEQDVGRLAALTSRKVAKWGNERLDERKREKSALIGKKSSNNCGSFETSHNYMFLSLPTLVLPASAKQQEQGE